ncbi:unnamed protein product [Phytophthora fragariaefolia]|uniref:Unnamed protein product n=1 Tax=Phytophthora fragariaefolia TaxID=1490495 RepID=A0A9W6XZU3_9STRA|nr:unnamed protein product [Phytophthora fragariaefolia]
MRLSRRSRMYTAFRANGEIYQWLVAPMGLAGMPGTLTRLMNALFGGPEFAAFVVVGQGLSVDPDKTSALANWPLPKDARDLQRFLGLAGYYRRFVPRFADLVAPLSDLLKKDVTWVWTNLHSRAVHAVKRHLLSAPILRLPDPSKAFIVTTDASKLAVGGVVSQEHNGFDHPVAYFSKKLNVNEQKWPTHEQELFAIKLCMGKWRVYLLGREFVVFTDNSACRWFLSHADLSPRLTRWLEVFGQFVFKLEHRAGHLNVVADALSRPPVTASNVVFDNLYSSRMDKIIVQGNSAFWSVVQANLDASPLTMVTQLDSDFRQMILDGYQHDKDLQAILAAFQRSSAYEHHRFHYHDGPLKLKTDGRASIIVLPVVDEVLLRVLHYYHDNAISAHPGVTRTYLAVRQWFYWQGHRKHVEQYVLTCECCVRSKSSTRARQGLLQPLPIPNYCWQHVTMDFVTGLPFSNGYNAVLVVVDRLSKRPCYIPTTKDVTAEATARLFFDRVVRYYGLPSSNVSDRDSKFCSKFWTALMEYMGIKLRMTVSKRAQAEGQSERQVRTLEDALRCTASHYGDDWFAVLPTVEYAHATAIHSSTRVSPFQLDTGRQPAAAIRMQEEVSGPHAQFVHAREEIVRVAKEQLARAQESQAKYHNQRRREVHYGVDDWVYLDAKVVNLAEVGQPENDPAKDPNVNKLLPRWIGPYQITARIVENAYRVDLPVFLQRRHPAFNIDQLKLSIENPPYFANRSLSKAAPAIYATHGNRMYVAEKLLQRRTRKGKLQYLVKWLDLPESQNSWEPVQKLQRLSHWQQLQNAFDNRQRQLNSGRLACKSSDEAKQMVKSMSTILDCLIAEVGWTVSETDRSTAISVIRNVAMAVDASSVGQMLLLKSEESEMVIFLSNAAAQARRKLHSVITECQTDATFSAVYDVRQPQPSAASLESLAGLILQKPSSSYQGPTALLDSKRIATRGVVLIVRFNARNNQYIIYNYLKKINLSKTTSKSKCT